MTLVRRLAAAFPSIAFLVGCKTAPSAPAPPSTTASAAPEPRSSPFASASAAPASSVGAEDRAADADGERRFVARLYGALAKKEAGNLFVSPSSARFALGMVLGGARGETEHELGELLGATPRMHDVAASLATEWAALAVPPGTHEWEKTDTVTLRSANRLFGQKDRAFVPSFVELTGQRYGAPIEAVDFTADPGGAARTINDWVAKRTEGRITNIVSPPPPRETKLALANALYFKAAWRDPFRSEATKPEPFFAASGAIPVPTMHLQTARKYGETTDAHIVELPYGGFRRGDIAMVLVVPKRVDGLAELERSLDPDQLSKWLRAPSGSQLVDLALPRFRIESTMSLADTLSELGAPSVFRYGKADLSGIDGTKELFLGLVVQKTFVAVDEKGTEAAAATVAVAAPGAAPQAPPKPIVVRADRPFLFLIRDVVRNRTLFIGRVAQPKAA